jgi:2'-5' RNA ligase
VRVFLAVPVGERLRGALTTALDDWRPRLRIAWTRPESWHLTLQFLGEWPEDRVQGLIRTLQDRSWPPAFTIAPGGLGAFPHLRAPRVLFLQMEGDGQAAVLAREVRRSVTEVWPDGPQDDKPFRGHLTLARIKRPLRRPERELLPELRLTDLPPQPVTDFALVASTLHREGARYRDIARFSLAGT